MGRTNRSGKERLLADLRREWTDPKFVDEVLEDAPFIDLASAIIGLRAALGMTQKQLADRAGTTQSVISRLESGRHAVSTGLLNRIASAVGQTWRPSFQEKSVPDFLPRIDPEASAALANVIHLSHVRPEIRHDPEAWSVSHRTDESRVEKYSPEDVRELFDRFVDSYLATGPKRRSAKRKSGYSSAV